MNNKVRDYVLIDMWLSWWSFGGDVLEAVIVEFSSIDFSIVVGVNFGEKLLLLLGDHLFVEELVTLELISHPIFQLFALEDMI